MMRRKGFKVTRDRRSGAGGTNKSDMAEWDNGSRLAVEAKDQKTLKVKEWARQASAAASFGQVPTVVFHDDELVLAVVPFNDLLDMAAENMQLRDQLDELQRPTPVEPTGFIDVDAALKKLNDATAKAVARGERTCKNGHVVDEDRKCLAKGCPYSRGYKVKREKRT